MITKKYAILGCLFVLSAFGRSGIDVKHDIHVVDDQGNPIPDAQVSVCFEGLRDEKDSWKGQQEFIEKGVSDHKGNWSVKGKTLWHSYVSVKKNGYYSSGAEFQLSLKEMRSSGDLVEQTATIVLRKIINPIPMYAWSMYMADKITMTNAWVGYDMLQAEWMPPYGKGMIEDVQFRFERKNLTQPQWANTTNFVSMRFLGHQNGLIGIQGCSVSEQSVYKWPYNAPRDGYIQKEYTVFISPRSNPEELVHVEVNTGTTNCFFRIRSRLDKDGDFIEGLYGKMRGPLDVSVWKKTIRYDLIYYVNPTPNDLNMEFDPKRNLVPKKEAKNAVVRP